VVLVLIGLALLASAMVRNQPSLTTALLGGAVVMSGLMAWTDAERNLRRRLAFAAFGAVLMGLYMLRR
jgi:formate-dependent nitrite reductase membrane component NrfD